MSVDEAVRDLTLDAYRGGLDEERAYVNVSTLYRDFARVERAPHVIELFAGMVRYKEGRL